MDISNYVRNQILFDIMNQTMIDNSKKSIINFLSRPVISVNNKNRIPFEDFYKNYRERDFNKLYDHIQELSQKVKKEEREEKLMSLTNEQLSALI